MVEAMMGKLGVPDAILNESAPTVAGEYEF
jgi:hypothetical protein